MENDVLVLVELRQSDFPLLKIKSLRGLQFRNACRFDRKN